MLKELDLRHPLGLEHDRKAPLLPFFTSVKCKHPTKVNLVRVSSALSIAYRRRCQCPYHHFSLTNLDCNPRINCTWPHGLHMSRSHGLCVQLGSFQYFTGAVQLYLPPCIETKLWLWILVCMASFICQAVPSVHHRGHEVERIPDFWTQTSSVQHHFLDHILDQLQTRRWGSSMRPWARMRWCWCSGQA